MKLNGKELRVLIGAIIVFQHIPLSKTNKRILGESEYLYLNEFYDRIMTSIENEYKKIGAYNYVDSNTIESRISISLNCSFSDIEKELIKETLTVCIDESKARGDNSINDYFGGDQYELGITDFKKLLNRFNN